MGRRFEISDDVLGGSDMGWRGTMIVMGKNVDNCRDVRTCLGGEPVEVADQLLKELVVAVLFGSSKRLSWNGINWMATSVGSGSRVRRGMVETSNFNERLDVMLL